MGSVTPLRRRDATRTRERLLEAAAVLFAERGFDRTTLREVGERAGADPALITRYFGSKNGLYLAALQEEVRDEVPADLLDLDRLADLLARVAPRGPSPVFRAGVLPHDDADVQETARAVLLDRLVIPLATRLAADGVDRPRLRAEVAVAAFLGIVLSRGAGTLGALAAAGVDDVVELTALLLGAASYEPR